MEGSVQTLEQLSDVAPLNLQVGHHAPMDTWLVEWAPSALCPVKNATKCSGDPPAYQNLASTPVPAVTVATTVVAMADHHHYNFFFFFCCCCCCCCCCPCCC